MTFQNRQRTGVPGAAAALGVVVATGPTLNRDPKELTGDFESHSQVFRDECLAGRYVTVLLSHL